MGFRQGAFAKVWNAKDNGNYSTCNVTVSRKKRDSDEYEVVFKDGFVRFVGEAHKKIESVLIPEKGGVSIQIQSCDVENRYDAGKDKLYTNYVIYDFEFPESNGGGNKSSGNKGSAKPKAKESPEPNQAAADDDELPF